jgi:hypothetical protein
MGNGDGGSNAARFTRRGSADSLHDLHREEQASHPLLTRESLCREAARLAPVQRRGAVCRRVEEDLTHSLDRTIRNWPTTKVSVNRYEKRGFSASDSAPLQTPAGDPAREVSLIPTQRADQTWTPPRGDQRRTRAPAVSAYARIRTLGRLACSARALRHTSVAATDEGKKA